MRICYTHANHTKPHTQPADVHTHVRANTCRQAGKRCPDARTAGGKFERRKVGNRTTEAEFVIFDDFLAKGLSYSECRAEPDDSCLY